MLWNLYKISINVYSIIQIISFYNKSIILEVDFLFFILNDY